MELSVLEINVWHGLFAQSWWRAGHLEPPEAKEKRTLALVAAVRALDPDVVTLQECFPQPGYSRKVAQALGYTCLTHITNAGFRILGNGFPMGCSTGEGLTILAKPALAPRLFGEKTLSGHGVTHELASFQFFVRRSALAAEVTVGGKRVLVATTHIRYEFATMQEAAAAWKSLARAGVAPAEPDRLVIRALRSSIARRDAEVEVLGGWLQRLLKRNVPLILAADMNLDEDACQLQRLVQTLGLTNAISGTGNGSPITWDPDGNTHTRHGASYVDALGKPKDLSGLLQAQHDRVAQRPDHVLLGPSFGKGALVHARVVLDRPVDGVMPSDHYGIFTVVRV